MSFEKLLQHFTPCQFFCIRIRMSWNIGDNSNLFLELLLKSVLCHVVLTTPKTFPEKLTLSVVEKQESPAIEKQIPKKKSLV